LFVEQHPLQTASNQRLQDRSLICDHSALADANIALMSNNANLLMISVLLNKKDRIVLHHFFEFGSSQLVTDSCTAMLFRNGDVTIPLAIDCEASSKAFTIGIPYDLFRSSDSVTNFKAIPTATRQIFTSSDMILISQAIGVPIMKLASKDAADIGVVVAADLVHHEVMAQDCPQDGPQADSFMVCCQYVLLFCKAVSEWRVPSTLCSPSEASHGVE
jgi:hypothetical protein